MSKPAYEPKYGKNTAFVVGFLFILLGSSTQAETSWLFTLGGVMALIQGLYDQRQIKHNNGDT